MWTGAGRCCMTRLGMVIDLKRCMGCNACVVACRAENGTPRDVLYARVYQREYGEYPAVRRFFLPVLCNHCEDPPCLKACPSQAIHKRMDGIVLVDEDKCVGSRACVTACPYGMILFPRGYGEPYFPGFVTPFEEYHRNGRKPDKALKCTFCVDRIDKGLEPACVITCPADARIFGDLDDPESKPVKYLEGRAPRLDPFPLRPEAGTKPNVLYLL